MIRDHLRANRRIVRTVRAPIEDGLRKIDQFQARLFYTESSLLGKEIFALGVGPYEVLILERIAKQELKREPGWTEAIAVGSEGYVRKMESSIRGRQQLTIESAEGLWTLKEAVLPYDSFSRGQNAMQWKL